jgi:hypothetical protein
LGQFFPAISEYKKPRDEIRWKTNRGAVSAKTNQDLPEMPAAIKT